MEKLTKAQTEALALLQSENGCIDCYDDRVDRFSEDGDPDTWNQLFEAGLAQQWYDNGSDTGTLRITEAGRLALRQAGER